MVHYDKQKFKTRIMNIMKINSPEMSIFIIRKLKNPLTGNEIGKNKAIRLYVTYALLMPGHWFRYVEWNLGLKSLPANAGFKCSALE